MPQYFADTNSTISWPTPRLASWAQANNINSIAELDTWLTNNVTNLAQARLVLRELLVALVQMSAEGQT